MPRNSHFGLALDAMRAWLTILPSWAPNNPLGLVFPGKTGARRQKGRHLHFTMRDPKTKKPYPHDPFPGYLAAAGIVLEKRHDGMHVRWHDLRHTFAASLVSGMWGPSWSLEEIKVVMGHKSVTTTERYAHLADSALDAAAARMGGIHKPTVSPQPPIFGGLSAALTMRNHSGSHLRDLNSRPTVYEPVPYINDFVCLSDPQAQFWAYEALGELASGAGTQIAGALLRKMVLLGHLEARRALAEAAAGRWSLAVDVFTELAERAPEAAGAAGGQPARFA